MASPAKRRRVNHLVSHLDGVKREVRRNGQRIQANAERIFARHNRPEGHEIVGDTQDTDYLVSLQGRAPHVLEYGRSGYTRERDNAKVGPMQGLYIIHKAAHE
jgi:hypothetical protein